MVKLGRAKYSVVPEKENCNLSLSHPRTCFLGLALLDPSELEQEKSSDSLISDFCIQGRVAAVPLSSSNPLALSSAASAPANPL